MASALNHKEIATDAELLPHEVDHFEAGLAGETHEPLPLAREAYDALQLILEERALAARDAGERVWHEPLGLWYFTANPPTPSYRPEHPRREVFARMFSAAGNGPRACSVFTVQGFHAINNQLSEIQQRAFADFLRSNVPAKGLPSVCMTSKDFGAMPERTPPVVNYFVLGGGEGREAVAFSAPQSTPAELSQVGGTLYFGMAAEAMKGRASRELEDNAQTWGAHNILRMLKGDGA